MSIIYESKKYRTLLRLAFSHLDVPTVKKSKHFTFVLRQGRLVVWGWNQRRQLADNQQRFTIHSEIHALNRLMAQTRNNRFIGKQYTIVNVRINREGKIGFAKPCNKCQEEMVNKGINEVIFSCDDQSFAVLGRL